MSRERENEERGRMGKGQGMREREETRQCKLVELNVERVNGSE